MTVPVVDQVEIERGLVVGEQREGQIGRPLLHRPPLAMAQQRGLVHQHRAHVGIARPEPVEGDEAAGVEVAPVEDSAVGQPGQPGNRSEGGAGAEDGQRARPVGEGEIAGVVLDDDHPVGGDLEVAQLLGADGQLGQPGRQQVGVAEAADPGVVGAAAKPVAGGEVAGAEAGVDPLGRQHLVEESAEQHPVLVDEVGVHPDRVDLAKIERLVVLEDPGHRGQQPRPLVGVVEQGPRGPFGPVQDGGQLALGRGEQPVERGDLVDDAEPAEDRLVGVEPDPPGERAVPDLALPGDGGALDPQPGPVVGGGAADGQFAQPGVDGVAALEQVAGLGSTDGQREGHVQVAQRVRLEDGAGTPAAFEQGLEFGRGGPVAHAAVWFQLRPPSALAKLMLSINKSGLVRSGLHRLSAAVAAETP